MTTTIVRSISEKLLEVQRSIGAVTKNASNSHFKSRYVDLNAVLDVVKPALNEQGIFVAQSPGADQCGKYLETSLIDAMSGSAIHGRVYFSGTEDNMQKIGAAITYARRFGLISLLALESEDDDGETAVGRGPAIKNATPAISSPVAPKTAKLEGVPGKSETTSRKAVNEQIKLTSEVIIERELATLEELKTLLFSYAVKTKEELTDDQAKKFLTQLKEKLNG